MINTKFFTDKTVINPYLLIKIKDFVRIREKDPSFLERYKEIFIDPGVYDLTKGPKFKWEGTIDIDEFLDSLKPDEYFSWDYPCDMNEKHTDLFLERTWENAQKYCLHPQYIVTVQNRFNNYMSFTKWFNRYNNLEIKSEILGLGNICRIFYLTEYIKHSLGYAFRFCKHPRIHIYGLALRNIKFAYNLAKKYGIKLSIDSTKWTRGVQPIADNLTNGVRRSCKASERQAFFDEYIDLIRKRGIKVNNI